MKQVKSLAWSHRIQSGGTLGLLALALWGCQPENTPAEREHVKADVADSTSHFESLILGNPQAPQPFVERATWHIRQGRITEGLRDLDLAIEADSTCGDAWSTKADILYLTQAFEPCIEHLDVCLKLAPDHTPCMLRRAEMHIHLRQYAEAFDQLNNALRQNPLLHEAYWMKGIIYREQGNADNAKSSFQTAVEVNPNFFDGWIALGLAYAAESDTLAVAYYSTAIELKPRSVEARYNLAYFLQEFTPTRDDYLNRAMALYKDIREIDPENATAPFNQGYIQLEYLANYDSALVYFTQAIEALPYYHQAFFNRGLAWESLNQRNEAELDYREALRIQPDYTPAALALERVLRGG
jgi:tetratricopeptide (TPR) repeat protein